MSDEYIRKADAVRALANYIMNVDKVYSTGKLTADDCIDCAKSVLDNLSSADVVPVVRRGVSRMNKMIAWEPIPEPKEGTCDTCRHLDRSTGYLTYPMQYRCKKTGELHPVTHDCDVPAFVEEE